MFVETSRSAQPRPTPQVPVVGLLTPTPADPDVEPHADLESHADREPPRTGVVRRSGTTATSTFRLRNGAEVTLGGCFGGSRGVWSSAFEGHRRRRPAR
ncbi:hypothetical protein [Curtobacterium sp. 260]|uniref:hypothetical protein n=1 Tax=Curtobacterium sp. 260 TaxID=2817748 RepID=UPI00277F25D1|nr:hypothetical protein [Curtobacterium sp. 260]MDP9736537.1 hypothetical protein [Curtobacterium sp. 260]